MEAACRQVDTTLFYSPEGERGPRKERREAAAKQICGSCKVVELCAAYAIATREPYGTWGGLSENDRRELIRQVDPRLAQAPLPHRPGRLGARGRRRLTSEVPAPGRAEAGPPAGRRRHRPWPRCPGGRW